MLKPRSALLASVCLLPAVLVAASVPVSRAFAQEMPVSADVAPGGTIGNIAVSGNYRIDSSTILAYTVVRVGDSFDPGRINESLKTLYATGLFKSVAITRNGAELDVAVVENPTVKDVLFSGNKELEDKDAKLAIALKSRTVFTPEAAEADRKALLEAYAKKGYFDASVSVNVIELPDNRVNVVFVCDEGIETKISRVIFIGNDHFSQGTLAEIVSSRENVWYRFLSGSTTFNAERVEYDEYLLHKFYLHKGYADVQVISANASLSPDRKSFYLTYDIVEGPRYRVGKVAVTSGIRTLTGKELRGLLPLSSGDWFDGDALQTGVDAINKRALNLGYAFATTNPDVETHADSKTIDITLNVVNGPRVYIQRIDITGNTRTEDRVIRRELSVAEGDAYNQALVDDSTKRLKNLGFFKDEKLTTSPGDTPNQVILNTAVTEQATGQFSLGGGYSTALGALLNAGLSQNNILGTGWNWSINGMLAQRGTQINLGITDPYTFDRNLITGWDLFRTVTNSYTSSAQAYSYSQSTLGTDFRMGYRFNEHVSQNFTYTISQRSIYNIPTASSTNIYVVSEKGTSTLSQVSQTLSFDYLDDDQSPTSGLYAGLTTDLAGAGGDARYARISPSADYYVPLERLLGSPDWVLKFNATAGDIIDYSGYHDKIEDRFFLGGDNLRGFADGGVGPYVVPNQTYNASSGTYSGTAGGQIGGRYIWTESTDLLFPLPVSKDLGIKGFLFADVGSTWGARQIGNYQLLDSSAPRLGVGIGVSWNTPFGLINLSLGDPVIKHTGDQVQQFRISFGTQF